MTDFDENHINIDNKKVDTENVRPTVKKVRVSFMFDEQDVASLKNLAFLRKTTATRIVIDCLRAEFERNRHDLDLMASFQNR